MLIKYLLSLPMIDYRPDVVIGQMGYNNLIGQKNARVRMSIVGVNARSDRFKMRTE